MTILRGFQAGVRHAGGAVAWGRAAAASSGRVRGIRGKGGNAIKHSTDVESSPPPPSPRPRVYMRELLSTSTPPTSNVLLLRASL